MPPTMTHIVLRINTLLLCHQHIIAAPSQFTAMLCSVYCYHFLKSSQKPTNNIISIINVSMCIVQSKMMAEPIKCIFNKYT